MLKLGLHVRLSMMIACLSMLTASFVSWRFYEQFYEHEEHQSKDSLNKLAETIYNTATIAAYANNQIIAEDVLTGLMKNQLVLGAEISTNSFTVFKGMSSPNDTAPITKILQSPFDEKDKLGVLIIHPRQSVIHDRAQKVAIDVVIQTSLIIFATGGFIMLFIWILIGRPLTSLAHSLNHVDPGNNRKRLNIPKVAQNTELDLFATTVNELLDRVQEKITEERKLREQMSLIAKNFEMMLELSSNPVIITDLAYQLKYFNPAFEQLMFSVHPDDHILESNLWMSFLVKDPDDLTNRIATLIEQTSDKSIDIKINTVGHAPNQWMSVSAIQAVNTYDEPIFIIFFNDITRQHEALSASEKAASLDHLTHLNNRRSAEYAVKDMFQDARHHGSSFAFIVMDLDGFKAVNDTYGHEAGDQVLIAVAERLSILSRKTDMIARWGGDEFVVALKDVGSSETLHSVRRYLAAICEPIHIDNETTVTIGASIGIVLCPIQASNFEQAFEYADVAMYQVKQSGKRGYQFYINEAESKQVSHKPA